MKLLYKTEKIEKQCTNLKEAGKLFGGNHGLAQSLHARINALEQAETLKDIVHQPTFHFHKLKNKSGRDLEGYFAIDVKSRKEQWRIIIQPLDENGREFIPCHIDEIIDFVKIIGVEEVSKHYE